MSRKFTVDLTSKIKDLDEFRKVEEEYLKDDYFNQVAIRDVEEKIEAEFDIDSFYKTLLWGFSSKISIDDFLLNKRLQHDLHIKHQFSRDQIYKNEDVFNDLKMKYFAQILKTVNAKFELVTACTYQNILNKVFATKQVGDYDEYKNDINILEKCFNNEEIFYHDRVEKSDIDTINEAILKMNKTGWLVKQIQGIESGKSYTHIQKGEYERGGSGAGAGYGFTEGIIILWEKALPRPDRFQKPVRSVELP